MLNPKSRFYESPDFSGTGDSFFRVFKLFDKVCRRLKTYGINKKVWDLAFPEFFC